MGYEDFGSTWEILTWITATKTYIFDIELDTNVK